MRPGLASRASSPKIRRGGPACRPTRAKRVCTRILRLIARIALTALGAPILAYATWSRCQSRENLGAGALEPANHRATSSSNQGASGTVENRRAPATSIACRGRAGTGGFLTALGTSRLLDGPQADRIRRPSFWTGPRRPNFGNGKAGHWMSSTPLATRPDLSLLAKVTGTRRPT